MRKLILLIFLIFLTIGCRTTKYVEVPVEKIHTEYIDKLKLDSIFIHDSIYNHDSVYIFQKGDTVFKYKEKIQYKYLIQTKYTDTSKTIEKTDTIIKTVPIYKDKLVNHLKWWQKSLMYIGVLVVIILLSIIGFKLYKLVRK